MEQLGKAFRGLLRAALGLGVAAAVLVLIFIAWWVAVLAVGSLLAYAGVRRMLGARRAQPIQEKDTAVIEGEYRVEPEALPDRRRR